MRRMIHLAIRLDDLIALRTGEPPAPPEPAALASEAGFGGADRVVVHLRPERAPVRDRDARILREAACCELELEIPPEPDLVDAALELRPAQVVLRGPGEGGAVEVPLRDPALREAIEAFRTAEMPVAVIVEPDAQAILAAQEAGLPFVRLMTDRFGRADTEDRAVVEFRAIRAAARTAGEISVRVQAGGALGYGNADRVASVPEIEQIVVGQAVAARAVFAGLQTAVREMRELVRSVRVEGES
jgi:pyridoxine 5-phosphate synthase